MDTMTVTVPEETSGSVEIRHVVTGPTSFRDLIRTPGRTIPEGYRLTCLYRDGALWMSDSPAERRDHYPAIWQAQRMSARRVLVNGLGIGMVVQALIMLPSVELIDVVEIDPDVIALVGDHYRQMGADHGTTVTIHQADAHTITWPTGTTWDMAWSDIWQHASTDNLDEMARLNRRYGRRVQWHGHWMRDELLAQRRRDRKEERKRRSVRNFLLATTEHPSRPGYWQCGCLINNGNAHRGGCPTYPNGRQGD